ncbi:hypothetical protein COV22_03910, partial [Candidatus Woesearchaeota archaeon CG10_big_fil_rev_8_21_14_0_10_47_5]
MTDMGDNVYNTLVNASQEWPSFVRFTIFANDTSGYTARWDSNFSVNHMPMFGLKALSESGDLAAGYWTNITVNDDGYRDNITLKNLNTSYSITGTYTSPVYDFHASVRLVNISVDMYNASGTNVTVQYKLSNTSSWSLQTFYEDSALFEFLRGVHNNTRANATGVALERLVDHDRASTKLYLDFEEQTGCTAIDKSGNNNNATLSACNSTPYWSRGYDSGLRFDGGNDFVAVPDSSSLNPKNAITVEAWINIPENFTSWSHDYDMGIVDKGNYRLFLDHQSGKVRFEVINGSGNWSTSYDSYEDSHAGGYSLAVLNGNLYAALQNNFNVIVFNGSNWSTSSGALDNTALSLASYKSRLYAGTYGNGYVYVFNESTWSLSYDSDETRMRSLGVYGGKLYGGTGLNGDIYVFNGSNWSLSYNSTAQYIYDLYRYNNKLYAAANTGNHIYVYDGSNWSVPFTIPDYLSSLSAWNGQLYAGGTSVASGHIFRINETNTTLVTDTLGSTIYGLTSYNGKLYAASSGDGVIYLYNGSNWSVSHDFEGSILDFATFNGRLYAIGYNNTGKYNATVSVLGQSANISSSTSVFTPGWHHIAATFNGSTMKIYVDGSLEATRSVSGIGIEENGAPLHIGDDYSNGMFYGRIAEVRV